jgi:hypothetical protein
VLCTGDCVEELHQSEIAHLETRDSRRTAVQDIKARMKRKNPVMPSARSQPRSAPVL